jgi:hypothetical protein
MLLLCAPFVMRDTTCPPSMRHATVLNSQRGELNLFSICSGGAAILAASIISTVAAQHTAQHRIVHFTPSHRCSSCRHGCAELGNF